MPFKTAYLLHAFRFNTKHFNICNKPTNSHSQQVQFGAKIRLRDSVLNMHVVKISSQH